MPVNNRDGQPKDTVRNIREVPEFVVNVVPYALADPMNASSATLPYGESEAETFAIADDAVDEGAPAARGRGAGGVRVHARPDRRGGRRDRWPRTSSSAASTWCT